MLELDNEFYSSSVSQIVGVDEAGRGCLLGPVVAGAVILPRGFSHPLINDSKKLSEKQREEAYQIIIDNAIAYGIGMCSPQEIDRMNILEASREAMMRAIKNMNHEFDLVVSDAMKLPNVGKPYIDLIKGDAKCSCIAAASILAKVTRDHICYELDKKYPQYQIGKHKGYVTALHVELLNKFGPIKEIYRFSYKPVKQSLNVQQKLF